MADTIYEQALRYHETLTPGALSVVPKRSLREAKDLALAYSPGIAGPVLKIAENPDNAYRYTGKGNLVAIVTNGTAILGLGNRGALASKPVMEGKAVLFKRFAGIDAFDIEINSTNPEEIIQTVALIEPTFGGVNLEDIKAPECFVVEEALNERMDIPAFHDDQHGTAVVLCAGLLNALEVAGKELKNVSIVLNGAGAAGIAVARMLLTLGCPKDHLTLCDSKGVVSMDRMQDMNAYKAQFARTTKLKTLADALRGADVFIGVSKAGVLTPAMLRSMARDPIVFAMANPEPEIDLALAAATRQDIILGSGKSDAPNQVNNLLCFPFIFRGALDTRARRINDAMKLAAIRALASLAHEPVPASVLKAYGLPSLAFGRTYLLPKPFDRRLLTTVSPAVARAAMETGVARITIDLTSYTKELPQRVSDVA